MDSLAQAPHSPPIVEDRVTSTVESKIIPELTGLYFAAFNVKPLFSEPHPSSDVRQAAIEQRAQTIQALREPLEKWILERDPNARFLSVTPQLTPLVHFTTRSEVFELLKDVAEVFHIEKTGIESEDVVLTSTAS